VFIGVRRKRRGKIGELFESGYLRRGSRGEGVERSGGVGRFGKSPHSDGKFQNQYLMEGGEKKNTKKRQGPPEKKK